MDSFKDLLLNLPFDITAEALAASLLDDNKNLLLEQFRIRPTEYTNTNSAREVSNITASGFDRQGREVIHIDINKEGIFDSLPEMIFHSKEVFEDEVEKAQHIATQRKNARDFFVPFEEEFYRSRIELELWERNALKGLNERMLDIYGLDLTQISKQHKEEILIFAFSLPFLNEIVGDLGLTCTILETVLKKKVTVSIEPPCLYNLQELLQSRMGSASLGDDLLLGETFSDGARCLDFSFYDIVDTEIEEWIPGGPKRILIEEKLFPFLLPAGEHYNINILISDGRKGMVLGDEMATNILGYTII